MNYACCKHKDAPTPVVKTYHDLSNQWGFSYPSCNGFDTSSHELRPIFSATRTTGTGLSLDKMNDSNTLYKVSCFYSIGPNNTNGTYFRVREARVDLLTDSISFTLFTDLNGDSMGTFTGKYNDKTGHLEGYYDTWYQMYCHCRFAGVHAPYRHMVIAE